MSPLPGRSWTRPDASRPSPRRNDDRPARARVRPGFPLASRRVTSWSSLPPAGSRLSGSSCQTDEELPVLALSRKRSCTAGGQHPALHGRLECVRLMVRSTCRKFTARARRLSQTKAALAHRPRNGRLAGRWPGMTHEKPHRPSRPAVRGPLLSAPATCQTSAHPTFETRCSADRHSMDILHHTSTKSDLGSRQDQTTVRSRFVKVNHTSRPRSH